MWGDNSVGQLGNGTREYSAIPIKIMNHVKNISLGREHSAAITEDGSLYMWGNNSVGQLGNGTKESSTAPIKIMDHVKMVNLGYDYSAAITEDGSLYMWGDNFYGQLGNGTTEDSTTPIKIMDHVQTVSLGDSHSAAITEDSSLYMWGSGYHGKLGNGTTEDSTTPIKIEIPPVNTDTAMSNLNLSETASSGLYSAAPLNLTQSPTLLVENYSTTATKSYQGLSPNMVYNFYVMKSETAESPLSSDNLLYITQAVSDANGNLEIPYIAKEQYENAVTFVKAASKTDLSSAQVTIPDILCNGAEQFAEPEVTLNEETLTEGVDYDIEKRYSAIYPGEYELIITGIRNYTGEVSATYNIYCEHNFADNKCTICKSFKDTVGDANGDGVVGIADLVVLQSFLLAKRNDISINADINQDGVINGLDLCMLRRIILDALN